MSIFIVITGAAGSGKSTATAQLASSNKDVAFIPLATIFSRYRFTSFGTKARYGLDWTHNDPARHIGIPESTQFDKGTHPIQYCSVFNSIPHLREDSTSTPLSRLVSALSITGELDIVDKPQELLEDIAKHKEKYLTALTNYLAKWKHIVIDSMENLFQKDRVLSEGGEDLAPVKRLGELEPLFTEIPGYIFTTSRLSAKNWPVVVGEVQGGIYVVNYHRVVVILPWDRRQFLFSNSDLASQSALFELITYLSAASPDLLSIEKIDEMKPGSVEMCQDVDLEEIIANNPARKSGSTTASEAVALLHKTLTAQVHTALSHSKALVSTSQLMRSGIMYSRPEVGNLNPIPPLNKLVLPGDPHEGDYKCST